MVADPSSQTLNPMRGMNTLFGHTEVDGTRQGFLPDITPPRKPAWARAVVSGTGIDELYTKNNADLLKLIDENKNYITENNQLKKLNEKLVDEVEYKQSLLDKEAASADYYYGRTSKNADALEDKNKGKASKTGDDGNNKMKKTYDDMMEAQKKGYEATIKSIKTSWSDEIESLTTMLGSTSRELVLLNLEHRELLQKFSLYHEKTEAYSTDREAKIVELEKEVQNKTE